MNDLQKSVNNAEPGDLETAAFYCEIGGEGIGIAPCPDDENITSIIGCDRFKRFFHLLLNKKETEIVIAALQEIQARQAKPPQ